IAHDDGDYDTFRMLLSAVAVSFDWTIIAFVLMGNHYHIGLRLGTVEKGLSRGMCFLNTGYATEYNRRYGRSNHLFGKRYWSGIIADDAQLLRTVRYVLLNPVRAKLVAHPADWPWSSY